MNPAHDNPLTSGEDSVLIEIQAEWAPITPETLRRPQIRPPRRFPFPTNNGNEHRTDTTTNEEPPAEPQ